MSGDKFNNLFECEYLDANLQNSSDMNLNCIKDKQKGENQLCQSDYNKIYDNISFNSQYINIKRDMSAGYGILPFNSNELNHKTISNDNKNNDIIEGYVNYEKNSFIVPEPSGERNVQNNCPDGFTYDGKKCIQICTDCKYKDNMKSQQFNQYDKCFPEGVYDGINKQNLNKCNCGKNNQYCSDKFYSAEGNFNDIKNYNINGLFDIRNL